MKGKVCFARSLFYVKDRVNREFKEIREIMEGATLDRADRGASLDRVDRVDEARVS